MNNWKEMTNGREKYHAYLASPSWSWRRQAVIERCDGVCEKCRKRPVTQVHHKTYANIYREPLEDLEGHCDLCHPAEHCLTTEQPTAKVFDTSRDADAAYREGRIADSQRLLLAMVESMQNRDAQKRARIHSGIRGQQ